MPTREELLEEADRRGLLQGEQKRSYDEAKRRGLLGGTRSSTSGANEQPRPYNAVTDYRSPLAPLTNSLRQGLSLGWIDEMGAAGRAALVAPFSERTFGQVYGDTLEEQRAELERGRREHPIVSTAAEIAGASLPTARIGSALMQTARRLPNWLKVGGLGATEGAVYASGSADDQKLASGAVGGAVGGVVAPATAIVAKPIMSGARRIWDVVAEKVTDTPRRQAERRVAEALQTDLADPAAADRLARVGKPGSLMTLADVGENTAGLARGAAAKPGPFRTAAADMLRTRQTGQQGRLIDSLGVRGAREFVDSFDDWASSRISAAKPHYESAYAAWVDVETPAFQDLLARPAMKMALRDGRMRLANEGGGKGRGPVAILDGAKRSLDDAIGVAQRAGKADEVRILAAIKRDLVAEIDRQIPAYAKARQVFAGEASLRNAADFGAELFERRVSHDEARRLVGDMTDSELQAFRRGALRGLIDQLERTPENRNAAAKLLESTAMRDKVRLLFRDEKDFARFLQTTGDEAQMAATRNTVLGGSPTARIQEESRALTGAGEIVRDIASGNHLGLFGRALRALGFGDTSPEVLDELSKLLLSNPNQQTLQRVGQAAARPPRGPIAPSTQAGTGGLVGAMSGMALGRSTNETPRPPLRAPARPTRAQLLASELERSMRLERSMQR